MSNYAAPARRRFALPLVGRKTAAVLLTIVVLTAAGTSAWGYWSSLGGGSGTAITGTLNAPTHVVASSTQGSGKVQVTWDAPTSGATPDGYYVVRIAQGGGTAAACGSSATALVSSPCTDTSVPDGTYSYAVTSVYRSWTATSDPSGAVTVVNTVPTSTSLSSSANPSVVGQTVIYTATVAPGTGSAKPTGSVTFRDAGLPVSCNNVGGQALNAAGAATCQLTYAAVGDHTMTAEYAGAPGFAESSSSALGQSVGKAATSTALASSASPSKSGQQVIYTATVSVTSPGAGMPIGSVTFKDGTTTICADQPISSGAATCSTTYPGVSSHSVTATYSGDNSFQASTSSQLNQSVQQAATSTSLTSSANPAVTGQPVTFTATVAVTGPGSGTPSGSVTFKDGTTALNCSGGTQSLNGAGAATCTTAFMTAVSRNITAEYKGDTNFSGSTSSTVAETVNKASTATSLTSSLNPSTTGQPVTLTATVTPAAPGAGAPGGSVQFSDNSIVITNCSTVAVNGAGIATCATSFSGAGSHQLTVLYSGDANYGASQAALTQTVNTPVTTTTSVTASPGSVVRTGDTVTFTATVSANGSTPTGSITFRDGTNDISGCVSKPLSSGTVSCATSWSTVGTHQITAVYGGDQLSAGSSGVLAERVVGRIAGLVFTAATVDNGAVQVTCSSPVGTSVSCSVPGNHNKSVLSASVMFSSASGGAVVYSDSSSSVTMTTTGADLSATSVAIAGNGTTSGAVTSKQNGSSPLTLTAKFTDALGTQYTATLTMN